ncbi:MAG: protease modulator HflC [Planctomycetota bacterium]|jgi:membrane protease subunit HflC
MKNIAITIFIVLIVVIMGLYLVSFQVRETESALVTTFGKPTRKITEPGWYFKWPVPIERVETFDSRMRVLPAEPGETTTKGAVPIIVNTYVVWEINDPLEFHTSVGTVREAKSKLLSQINDTQNRVIGLHEFGEFVNSDPSKIKFEEIEREMHNDLQQAIGDANYGIEIKALGIKQLKISKDVTEAVFKRMRAERERRTIATITEGNAEATKITADANSIETILLAAAEARAKAMRGQGDAEAAKYYKMLDPDPELAMFLREVDALKVILRERATVVLPADARPIRLLKEMPDLKPKK